MKRVIFLLMLVLITSFTVNSTIAYFQASVASENNTISTGTLKLSMDSVANESCQFSNLEPGKEKLQTIKLRNNGTLPLRIWSICLKRDAKKVTDASYVDMYETYNDQRRVVRIHSIDDVCARGIGKILFRIDNRDVLDIPVSLIDSNNFIFYNNSIVIEPGDTKDLQIVLNLDDNLGNEFQGNLLRFGMEVKAVQVNYDGGIDIARYKVSNPIINQYVVIDKNRLAGFHLDGSAYLVIHLMIDKINETNLNYIITHDKTLTTVKIKPLKNRSSFDVILNGNEKNPILNNICAVPSFKLYSVDENLKNDVIAIDSINNDDSDTLKNIKLNYVN